MGKTVETMPDKPRPEHFISPNHGSDRPHHAILFDTETKTTPFSQPEEKHDLKLGWACYWTRRNKNDQGAQEWFFFTTTKAFWSFVVAHLDPQKTLYLIAHNIAFDFRIVGGFGHAERSGWTLDFIYCRNMTTLATYLTPQGKLQLLDMANFYPTSLEKIGESVGLSKTKISFNSCSWQELSDYCRNDAEILVRSWEAWLDFLDDHNLGDFKHTLASQAFAAYRHIAMNYPIRIHNDPHVCRLERAAYRGGRTEVFMVGKFPKGKYHQVDVNGMYAYCMATFDYPRMLRVQHRALSTGRLRTILKKYCAIAKVSLVTDYPVFPVRMDRINIYPVGAFETVLSTPELEFALDNCKILRIGPVALYEKSPLFRGYAEYFATLKEFYWKEGNKPFREIAKRFANSLYGKFGQCDIETDVGFELPPLAPREIPYFDWRTKEWVRIYKIGHQTILERTGGESFNSFPAIPAHVTAYARMYLWSLIQMAGQENCFYADTDSLIVNQQGFDNLQPKVDSYKLGYLKLEKSADSLEIWGPKDYCIGDKSRIKGVKKDAIRIGPCVFEQSRFLGLRGALRHSKPDLVTVKTVRKTLHREIRTGIVQPNGRVEPFRLPL